MSPADKTFCVSCEKPMSAVAAVCPHCGARQKPEDPADDFDAVAPPQPKEKPLGNVKVSREEAKALLQLDATLREPKKTELQSQGIFTAVLFPHPEAFGMPFWIEVILTVIAVPIIASGFLGLALVRSYGRRARSAAYSGSGSGAAYFAAILVGAPSLYFTGPMIGWSNQTSLILAVGCSVALILRGLLRWRLYG